MTSETTSGFKTKTKGQQKVASHPLCLLPKVNRGSIAGSAGEPRRWGRADRPEPSREPHTDTVRASAGPDGRGLTVSSCLFSTAESGLGPWWSLKSSRLWSRESSSITW